MVAVELTGDTLTEAGLYAAAMTAIFVFGGKLCAGALRGFAALVARNVQPMLHDLHLKVDEKFAELRGENTLQHEANAKRLSAVESKVDGVSDQVLGLDVKVTQAISRVGEIESHIEHLHETGRIR